jgi:hypothetical protein
MGEKSKQGVIAAAPVEAQLVSCFGIQVKSQQWLSIALDCFLKSDGDELACFAPTA